jgi:hypothetical protein
LGQGTVELLKTVTRAVVDKEITRCPHKETSVKMEEVSKRASTGALNADVTRQSEQLKPATIP